MGLPQGLGLPHGFGVAPGAKGLLQGLWGCPKGKGVAPGVLGSPRGKGDTFQTWGPHPRIGLGHNLQHVALFGALTGGFCMFFRYAFLIFLTPEPIFGARTPHLGALTPHLGPGRPGGPFGAQKGAPKNITMWRELVPHQFPPKPSQGKVLQGFPPNPKIQGASLGPWVGCLLCLCGPLAPWWALA